MNLLEKAYVMIHFPLVILFYHELSMRNSSLNQFIVTCGVVSLLASMTSMGFILEKRWFAPLLEFVRCLLFFTAEQTIWPVVDSIHYFDLNRVLLIHSIRVIFLVSAVACAGLSLARIASKLHDRIQKKQV